MDVDCSDDDLVSGGGGWCRTGGGGGLHDELRVDLHEVLELDQLASVGRLRSGLDYGDGRVVCAGVDPLHGVIGVLGKSSIHAHGVPSVLGIVIGGNSIGILRSREGGGDQCEKTEPEQEKK